MSPADRSLLSRLGGRPLFRCSGGWRRGDIKITARKASELIGLGALRRTTSRRGAMMLVAQSTGASATSARAPAAGGANGEQRPIRAWWLE